MGEIKTFHEHSLLKTFNLQPKGVLIFLGLSVFLLSALFMLTGRGGEGEYIYRRMLMDTVVELRFFHASAGEAEEIGDEVFIEMQRLESLFDRSSEESEISLINNQAPGSSLMVSKEMAALIEAALFYSSLSEGYFDPTVAPLVDLWGFYGQKFYLPAAEEIALTLGRVDYRRIDYDDRKQEIALAAGTELELGGIAKGFIVDCGIKLLKDRGVKSAFINAGGDIGLLGVKPDGSPWQIGIRHPRDENRVIARVSLEKGAIVTSGDYERSFSFDGVTYHHILDPKTGMPARSLMSVTIVAPTAVEADALSTALFVLGPERGMLLIEKLTGVGAVLITPELEIIVSDYLQDYIILNP